MRQKKRERKRERERYYYHYSTYNSMGVGTHKHDCLVSLNDFAFTNALVKRGGRRRKRSKEGNEEKEEEENGDDFFGRRISKRDHHHGVNDDGIRPIRIEFAREGNCVITVGKTDGDSNECQTKAHCAVTSTLKAPLGRAAEGSLRVHVKMSPMAHPTDAPVEKRRENETCANLARMIEKCFRDARALDLESLCVSAGRYAWHLRLDVTILNHGGDLPLAASVGANCALMSFRRCECSIDNETNRVTFHEERESVKLQLMHHPVAVRFAFYDGRNSKGSGFDEDEENNEEEENNKPHQKYGILADAGVEEEACAIGFATVAVNEHGETCFSTMDFMGERLGKSVTRGVDATTLAEVHSTASNLAKEVCKEMKEAHERFEQKRLEEKTRRRKYDPDALERAALKADADEKEEEEEEYKDKDALLEDAEAMDEEARASEDSPDDEEDDNDAEEHVPLVSLKPPQNKSSSSSSSSSSEDDGEKSSEAEDDDIDDMFDKAEKKQAKKRAKIAAKTWDEALPGDGKKLSDAVMKRKKPNKKAPAKAKKLTKK